MVVGEKLGSFRIDGTLGVGAMGVVYRATHETTGKAAAVKVVNKEIAQRGKTYERFQREAEILQQFRHPNIVRFLAVGRYQGTSYIAMEFVPGKTLEQVLEARGALPWKEVVDLGVQICEALQYAHDHGVVHRDLKPSNLMITEDGRVKLTDFGIAKDLDKTALTATGRTLGTAAYMAPEQIRGTPDVSHKTDLYALGCVLYQMLTGQAPYSGGTHVVLMHCHLNEPVPRPSAKLAEIPKALDDLVAQLMAKAPTDRPWDAAAAAAVLTKVRDKARKGDNVAMVWPSDDSAPSGPQPRATETARKLKKKARTGSRKVVVDEKEGWTRRLPGTLGLVAALAVVGGVIGYIVWPPGQRYLYAHAERLMASADPHDWQTARDEYLEPLDRRFPDHPYKSTTRDWRDKILVADIEGRAKMLEAKAGTKFNEPKNEVEARWVGYHAAATAAHGAGDDEKAANAWEDLARSYKADADSERGWHLMARARADELRKEMAVRRGVVEGLVAEAKHATLQGNRDEASRLWKEILDRYGRFKDLADLLAGAPQAPTPAEPADPPNGATPPAAPTPDRP
jgi:serine/threonine-protein kinase